MSIKVDGPKLSFMLTGGRSAKDFYQMCAAEPSFYSNLGAFNFYFGDERCVTKDHPDSNYRMVLETLFANHIPTVSHIHRILAESPDLEFEAERYSKILPKSLDVLLLSMGEDGHIASLFPYSSAIRESRRLVVPVLGCAPPHKRITITPKVIQDAKRVFVLALGERKRAMYKKALLQPENFDEIPARLVLDKTWIFDKADFRWLMMMMINREIA